MVRQLLASAIEGAQILGISERLFHQRRHDPGFPAAVQLGPRCKRWRVLDLEQYVASLPAAAPSSEPLQLVQARRPDHCDDDRLTPKAQ